MRPLARSEWFTMIAQGYYAEKVLWKSGWSVDKGGNEVMEAYYTEDGLVWYTKFRRISDQWEGWGYESYTYQWTSPRLADADEVEFRQLTLESFRLLKKGQQ